MNNRHLFKPYKYDNGRSTSLTVRNRNPTSNTTGGGGGSGSSMAMASGFYYGSHAQSQPSRYPPWADDPNRAEYPLPRARPFTANQIPENFHEYHFRSSYGRGRREPSSSYASATVVSRNVSRTMAPIDSQFGGYSDGTIPSRKWEHTGLGSLLNKNKNDPALTGGGSRFTIMCYNILAPSLQKEHPELYRKCDSAYLKWEYRQSLLLEEIDTYVPDIICLQEVEIDQFYRKWTPKLADKGYRGEYKRKTGDKLDGCAIFYRTSKFLLIDKLDVEFLQPHVPLLNRDNIGLLVKLETRNVAKRQKIVVGTTHLLFNPKRQDVRLAQVQLMLAELDRLAFSGFDRDGNTMYYPILMTGDFNSNPYTTLTKLFADGRVQYQDGNDDLSKLLTKKGFDSLLPRHSGISDQCQHYKIILERYKRWQSQRLNNYEGDQKYQEDLVNIYPYIEGQGNLASEVRNDSDYFTSPKEIVSLLSPGAVAAKDIPSFVESGVSDGKLLAEVSEKLAMKVNSSRVNSNMNSSDYVSLKPLHPSDLRQSQLDRHVLEELEQCGLACDFSSGALSHNFNFRDIYKSKLDRRDKDNEAGVTTKQNGWTCVDYIYQSMTWNPQLNKTIEGKLKLIRRLGLFTRSECKQKGDIPNEEHPSDHFPLVAEFLLRN